MSNNKQLDSTVNAVDKVKLLRAAESVRNSLQAHTQNYDNSKLIRDALNYSQRAFENIDYIVNNKKIVEVSKDLLDDLVMACKEIDCVNKNSLTGSSNKYLKDVEIGFEKVHSHTKQLVELIDNQHDEGDVERVFDEVKKIKQFTQSL